MNFPAFLMGMLISSIIGLLFHMWKDGGTGRLLFYLILAWAGFWAGHFGGNAVGWGFLYIGPLNFGFGVLGAAVFLFAGDWLSLVEVARD